MTFDPVMPAVILLVIAAVVVAARAVTLNRLLATSGPGRRQAMWRWIGLTLAVLLLLMAAARPGLSDTGETASATAAGEGRNVNVFFVVDRSVDSGVEDFGTGESRMAGMRDDMTALIDQYPQARFAVISFASTASMDWPLSDDMWSLKPMIAGLTPYTSPPTDVGNRGNAWAADNILRYKLQQAKYRYPDSRNLVFYFGAGAGGPDARHGTFDLRSARVSGGAVLGYGTSAGGPIPGAAGTMSALNEPVLRAVADQLGIPYVHRQPEQAIGPALSVTPSANASDAALVGVRVAARRELYWVLTLLAAALLLGETYLTIRQFRHNRTSRQDVAL